MLVTRSNLLSVVERLEKEPLLSCDTETTGLFPWKGDRLFSIIFGAPGEQFYFNFQDYEGIDPELVLPRAAICSLTNIFSDPTRTLFFHNAKFDLAMLWCDGITDVRCVVHDTEVGARIEYNDHMKYGLAECAERIGFKKSDAVEAYIAEHKLWEWEHVPGKKAKRKNKFYTKVPFPIISEYGLKDAEVTFALGLHQLEQLREAEKVLEIERKATPILFRMERVGFRIDREFCRAAVDYEEKRAKEAAARFEDITRQPFKDSPKALAQLFTLLGFELPKTEKGNSQVDDVALEAINHPAAQAVRDYRTAHKRMNTYFRSFLFWADEEGRIHPNIRQSGTRTGRMSCAEPNLQNIPKGDDDSAFPVRRAFIPEPGTFLGMIDYNQMEFRLMLDYARQRDLIGKIMAGHDPHQATADLTGLERRYAKNLNFGLLYGMGAEKLSHSLNCSIAQAKRFRSMYFANLEYIEDFLSRASGKARMTGKVRAWSGRTFHFPDINFSYKAANAIIQGGCADVVKEAMRLCDEVLQGTRSVIHLQVHDELLFGIAEDEAHLLPRLKDAMERAYPFKLMPLTCSVSHSFKSWGDPVEGLPGAGGEQVSDQGQGATHGDAARGLADLVREDSADEHPWNAGFSPLREGAFRGAGAEA